MRRRPPSDPQALSEILDTFLSQQESEHVAPKRRVERAWAAVCEHLDIRGTRIAGYRAGEVQIEVASPPLCAELSQFRRQELERALAAKLGSTNPIKSLRFRLGVFE